MTKTPGLRPMEIGDVEKAHVLLNEYLRKFDFAPVFKTEVGV